MAPVAKPMERYEKDIFGILLVEPWLEGGAVQRDLSEQRREGRCDSVWDEVSHQRFRAVAVMHVKIKNRHAFDALVAIHVACVRSGDSDIALGEAIPGLGRAVYLSMAIHF